MWCKNTWHQNSFTAHFLILFDLRKNVYKLFYTFIYSKPVTFCTFDAQVLYILDKNDLLHELKIINLA